MSQPSPLAGGVNQMCTKGLLADTLVRVLDESSLVTGTATRHSTDGCPFWPWARADSRPAADLHLVRSVALPYLS